MATMTHDDLAKVIKETTVPLIKEFTDTQVGELVEAAVRKGLESQRPPEWIGRLFPAQDRVEPVKREKGLAFASCLRALTACRHDPERAAVLLEKEGSKDLAEAMRKALTAGTPTAGGFLVPLQFSAEVIELLRAPSIIRRLGPLVVPMPSGNLSFPKITSGTTGYYVGESSNITPSSVVTGQLKLSFKKLAVLVPISNDLLRYSSPAADSVVRDDAVRCIAETENSYFIRSTGASGPKGLRYWAHADNVIKAASTSLANATTDLGKLVRQLMAADVPFTRPGWLFSPRSYIYLTTVQTTTGNFAFRDEMLQGRLWGWPFAVTTSIPENLTDGGSTSESEVYLADFADVVLGESMALTVDASSEAAYYDGSSVVAAFSRDETVVRVIEEHDLGARRDKSIAVLYGVKWGA